MANSRCVVVLSLPRAGSSAVAGCLHRLGVDMGEGHLQPPDPANPRGYYEDTRWSLINKAVVGFHYDTREPEALSERHRQGYGRLVRICAHEPLWGMKSPRLCFVLHLILPILQETCDVRLVHVQRDWAANIASLQQHSKVAYRGRLKMTGEEAEALLSEWQAALERRLAEFDGPMFEMDYDDLIDDPVATLTKLEAFCFEGMEGFSAGIEGAVAWIDPLLRHEAKPTIDATNAALELALNAGVDLSEIAGTGQDGRLLVSDVKQYLEELCEDTDADAEPEAGGGDDTEGGGDGGDPERRG